MSARGIMSDGSRGLAMVRISNGIARLIRWLLFGRFGVIPMESSIYISTFPKLFSGRETDNSLAGWNGMVFGRLSGGSRSSDKGS